MDAAELRKIRQENAARDEFHRLGWYHGFRFADGTEFPGVLPVEVSEHRYSRFPIPNDLTGKRVLDIGAWDGWFSFEAERHGAQVTAIDMVEVPNFRVVQRKLSSRVDYREMDLFEVPSAGLGRFHYVFFLGVLYHTKYPLLALELVCGLTIDLAIVESYVTDAADWEQHRDSIPTLEFYEAEELGGQLDNWFGPTVSCLIGMCRAAGFARVQILDVDVKNSRAALACYRTWEEAPAIDGPAAPFLKSVTNTIRGGLNFRSKREEYLTWWFEYSGDNLHRDDLRLQVGDVGVPAMYAKRSDATLWSANSRLPPGMNPGWFSVRMSIRDGNWSDARRIAVDVPETATAIEVRLVCDGRDWTRGEVHLSNEPAHISLWVAGLGENSDAVNTCVLLNGTRLKVTFISELDPDDARQVNAEIPSGLDAGEYAVSVTFGGVKSAPQILRARQSHLV